jgi:catechol 2,3-dioxygenase-like lactoylglutathione lyase family enzyme
VTRDADRPRIAIDHVQVAAPPGCEAAARQFYGEILGLPEIEKPEALRSRGGCWFACGAHQLHVGVEQDFHPSRKAHVGLAVSDLDALGGMLIQAGFRVDDDDALPDRRRFYCDDPWGNRLEFMEVGLGDGEQASR